MGSRKKDIALTPRDAPHVPNIPLLCLECGNAVLTPRDLDWEIDAAAIATHGCAICDESGENNEQFYITKSGDLLSFGQWVDLLEARDSQSDTKSPLPPPKPKKEGT